MVLGFIPPKSVAIKTCSDGRVGVRSAKLNERNTQARRSTPRAEVVEKGARLSTQAFYASSRRSASVQIHFAVNHRRFMQVLVIAPQAAAWPGRASHACAAYKHHNLPFKTNYSAHVKQAEKLICAAYVLVFAYSARKVLPYLLLLTNCRGPMVCLTSGLFCAACSTITTLLSCTSALWFNRSYRSEYETIIYGGVTDM